MATFGQQIKAFANKTGVRMDKVVRKIALDTYVGVVKRSPVDTGRFRGNWRVALNRADLTTTEEVPAESQGVTTGSSPTPGERAKASRAISEYQAGDVIIISNNLPYGKFLNDGSSRQAPRRFVERTIQEQRRKLRQAVREIR